MLPVAAVRPEQHISQLRDWLQMLERQCMHHSAPMWSGQGACMVLCLSSCLLEACWTAGELIHLQ